MQRVIFIHGNSATHWDFAFSSWLKESVEDMGYQTFFETMPDSVIARSSYWLPFMKDKIMIGQDDTVVGFSTGAVAMMRYAETNKVGHLILVSPSYTDMDDELERQGGYFDKPWDWAAIKSNCSRIDLVYGDDDPYIEQAEFEHIATSIEPQIHKVPGGKHFLESRELPVLIDIIGSPS